MTEQRGGWTKKYEPEIMPDRDSGTRKTWEGLNYDRYLTLRQLSDKTSLRAHILRLDLEQLQSDGFAEVSTDGQWRRVRKLYRNNEDKSARELCSELRGSIGSTDQASLFQRAEGGYGVIPTVTSSVMVRNFQTSKAFSADPSKIKLSVIEKPVVRDDLKSQPETVGFNYCLCIDSDSGNTVWYAKDRNQANEMFAGISYNISSFLTSRGSRVIDLPATKNKKTADDFKKTELKIPVGCFALAWKDNGDVYSIGEESSLSKLLGTPFVRVVLKSDISQFWENVIKSFCTPEAVDSMTYEAISFT